jgi:hypothetical protein
MIRILLLLIALSAITSSQASAQQMVGDGITDNTPILNQIVSNICASNDRKLDIGMGVFLFKSPPNGIPCSLKITGEGPGVTYLTFDYDGDYAWKIVGGIDPYGGGILRDASITVTSGHKIGFAIWAQAHLETDPTLQSHNPHGYTVENVIISRHKDGPFTGSWNYCIYADGSLNATPPAGIAIGMRYMRVLHSSCSGWNILPALAYYAYGTRFVAFDCYIGLVPGQPYQVEGLNDQSTTMVIAGPDNVTCPYVHSGT